MQEVISNVFVGTSPVFELLASMFRLQSHENLSKIEATQTVQDFEMELWVDRTRKIIPDEIKQSLELFFHYESYIGLSMVRFSWHTNTYGAINEFVEVLKKTPAHQLFAKFLQTGFVSTESVQTQDNQAVIDFIKSSVLPDAEKWKLAYLYLDVENTKVQFINLVEQCYELYFANEWERLLTLQEDSIHDLLTHLKRRSDIKERFHYIDDSCIRDADTTIVLSPSVFYHSDSLSSDRVNEALFINLYGIYQSGRMIEQDEIIESFKILSDVTRIKIIKALSSGACYGYELAQRLHLSSSTISHHLGLLSSIGLVSAKRQDNKVYYELNKNNLSQLMSSLTRALSQ